MIHWRIKNIMFILLNHILLILNVSLRDLWLKKLENKPKPEDKVKCNRKQKKKFIKGMSEFSHKDTGSQWKERLWVPKLGQYSQRRDHWLMLGSEIQGVGFCGSVDTTPLCGKIVKRFVRSALKYEYSSETYT